MVFRWDDCLEGHHFLGLFLHLAAFILLVLTAFSTPYIKSIYFLKTDQGTKYGSFGYCEIGGCTGRRVGYDHGPEVIEWLTRTQILFAIAALFLLISLIALLWSLTKRATPSNPIWFRTTALVATHRICFAPPLTICAKSRFFFQLIGSLCAILAEVFALILWVTARHRYDASDAPGRATYGAALWLGLVGAIVAFISACIGGPAYTGNYGMHWANRNVAYNL